MSDLKQRVKDELSESKLCEVFDEKVLDYVDRDQMERYDLNNAYEWYSEFGTGEAESDVLHWVANKLNEEPSRDLKDTILDVFPHAPL